VTRQYMYTLYNDQIRVIGISIITIEICLLVFLIKPRAVYLLGKCITTELLLHPKTWLIVV
jgi:hypothetical protein